MLPRLILFLAVISILPAALLAGGKIRGRVIDRETKEPLVGANVTVLSTSAGTAAGFDGEFTILNLAAGTYTLRSAYVGYGPMMIQNVRVFNDLTTEVDFPLTAEAVLVQAVVVTAERPIINKSSTNAVRIVTSDEIQAIPLRGVANIVALQPGVVEQDGALYIRGGRLDEVGYYLEGVNTSDAQYGGQGVTIVQDALEEISVQSAGYDAEYGRANAGIVQQQLRTGGSSLRATLEYITDNIAFSPKSEAYSGERRLGTYWYGYNELTATLSGPLLTQRLKFFGLFNYNYQRDKHPQPYPGVNIGPLKDAVSGDSINLVYPAGILLKNSVERYTATGTLTAEVDPLRLRFSGSYSKSVDFAGAQPYLMLDLDRVTEGNTWSGFGSVKATFFFNPTTFLEASGGLFYWTHKEMDPALRNDFWSYDDSVANALAGYVWERRPGDATGRYQTPGWLSIHGFWFAPPGALLSYDYVEVVRNNVSLNIAFSTQLGRDHMLKLGGDFQRFTIRTYQPGGVGGLAGQIAANNTIPDGNPQKRTVEEIMRANGTNNYGFDVLGNVYNGDDFQGPRRPVFASLFVQDKMEYGDLVVNLGLRYDYIHTHSYVLVDPQRPEVTYDYTTLEIDPNGLRGTTPFQSLSPRLGVAFPVTDRTVFHVQFAKFVQQSRLRDVNLGLYSFGNSARFGGYSHPLGMDLRPMRTTQYEIGFTQQIAEVASIDITGYYKDIKDQIVIDKITVAPGSPFTNYTVYVNGDYATTKGLELMFKMRRTKRFQASVALSFQDARGSGSNANADWGILLGTGETKFRPEFIAPLSQNEAISGNVLLDYRFDRDDGGPILQELGLSGLCRFGSGYPYTRNLTQSEYNRSASKAAEPVNSSTTPWTFQFDFRIDKTFRLGERLGMTFSLYALNVLDTKNVQNVWLYTGSAEDDGWLSDPTTGGQYVKTYGQIYADLYRAMNLNYSTPPVSYVIPSGSSVMPYFYGMPRQIRLGLRLEY